MTMSRLYYALTLLVFAGAFFALQASARAHEVYPAGLRGSDVSAGVYPGENAGDCCWMAPRGAFSVEVPAGADTIQFKVYLPAYAAQAPQGLVVRIDGAAGTKHCCFGAGEHDIVFALPAHAANGPVHISFEAQRSFEPKSLGINDDTRDLSMMLREVAFVDSTTGELLEASPSLWQSSRSHVPYLALFGILALVLTMRRPLFGVLALIASDPFLFAYTYHGKMITLPKVVLLAVALGILPRVVQLLRGKPSRTFYLLAGAQLSFCLSMVLSSMHAGSAASSELTTAFEYLGTFIVGYFAYRLDPDERAIRIALAGLTIVVALTALLQPLFGAAETELVLGKTFARVAGQLEGPNQLAGFFDVILPAILAFVVIRRGMILEYVALGAGAVASILTFSRAGVSALLLACIVLLALRYVPARRALIGAATLGLFALAMVMAFGVFANVLHGGFASMLGSAALNGGLGSRADLWHGAYAMWRGSPLIGVGAGNYERQISQYFPGVRTHANGMFFQVLAEQGLVGLAAMLAVVAAASIPFRRRLDAPLVLGAVMATVALTFHQIGDCMWLFPKVGVLWWVLLALAA